MQKDACGEPQTSGFFHIVVFVIFCGSTRLAVLAKRTWVVVTGSAMGCIPTIPSDDAQVARIMVQVHPIAGFRMPAVVGGP